MRVLFMGTPDFAVPSFTALCINFEVVGAVTQPDKPKGRGCHLAFSPIKDTALKLNIPVYQPSTLKDGAFLDDLKKINPDIIAVVAYGKILPKYLLDYPRLGCINLHGSLLPKYRGAAPMQRAIIDGEEKTGVTTMYMAEGLDTGDMLEKAEISIDINDDFETIHDKLSTLGAELLVSTLKKVEQRQLIPQKQDDAFATYAQKIEKADCYIDFSKSAFEIHNLIRGLSPIPLAYTTNRNKMIKIISSEISERSGSNDCPGKVLSLKNGKITVACGRGAINITRLTPEGKRPMLASDFINGRQIDVGEVLGQQ